MGNCMDAALLLIRALRLWIVNGGNSEFEICALLVETQSSK